jgi:hypothetical protein
MTLRGESQTGVVIDATSVSGWALLVGEGNDDVTLESFTILGGGDETIKTNFLTGLSIKDVTAKGSAGSEIDLNNVTNSTLTNVTADGNGTPGVGFALTGVQNVTLSNVTTTGNNWGGVGIFDTKPSTASPSNWTLILQPDNVEITGSFNEPVSVYTDDEFGGGIGDLILPNFNFTVENPDFRSRGGDFVFYKKTEQGAVDLAGDVLGSPTTAYIRTLTRDGNGVVSQTTTFIVGTSTGGTAMSVQTAVDAAGNAGASTSSLAKSSSNPTINLLSGTYNEDVTFGVNGSSGFNVNIIGEAAPNRPVLKGTLASTGVSGVTSEWTDVTIKNLIIENNGFLVYWSDTHGSGVILDNVLFENVDFRQVDPYPVDNKGNPIGYPIWTHGLSATTVGTGGLTFKNVNFDNRGTGTPNFFRANLGGSGALSVTNSSLTDAVFNWDGGQGTPSPTIDFINNNITGGGPLLSRQSNITVRGNTFDSNGVIWLNAPISTEVTQNVFKNINFSDAYSIRVTNTFGASTGQKVEDVSIKENTFSNVQGRAVWFNSFDNTPTASTLSGIEIKNNDLSGAGGSASFPVIEFDVTSPTDVDATCNWWGSTDSGTVASKIDDGGSPITFMPFRVDGTDNESGTSGFQPVPGSCTGGGGACDFPTLGADDVDESKRTVENTMSDQEGIAEFRFSVLDNFTVDETVLPSGYTRGGSQNRTWTWNGSGTPPTTVNFKLQAEQSGQASYFLIATDNCSSPDPLTTNFDPVYDLESDVPTKLTFTGNYPNPFGGATTIEFALPERADVRLTVYDVMGRQVATLADGAMGAGTHQVRWSGEGDGGQSLGSGVYLMRLQVGDETRTGRLTIVR